MTVFSLVPAGDPGRRRLDLDTDLDGLRAAVALGRSALRRTRLVAWVLARTLAVVLARVLLWCSADARRLRTIALGVTTCAAVGAVIGLGTGLLLAGAVRIALGMLAP